MRVLSVSKWSQRVLWENCVTHQVSSAPVLDPCLLLLALLSPTEFTSRASCRRDRATETDPRDLPPGTLFLFLLKPRTVASSISVPRLKAKQLEIWGSPCCFSFLKLCVEAAQVLGLKIAFTLVLFPPQYSGTLGLAGSLCCRYTPHSGVQMDLEVTYRCLCSLYSRPGTSIQSGMWVSFQNPLNPAQAESSPSLP